MGDSKQKIRMGMVGGGSGSFIGAIHRIAANLDGQIELVCGAFSGNPETSIASGQQLYLPEERCYPDFNTMFKSEAALPEHVRMDFVAIVTPNHLHFPIAKQAFAHGFHVLSDKPATYDLAQVLELKNLMESSGCLYGLTHPYVGYPLVKQARHLVSTGKLGKIVKIVVEYSQGWLANSSDELNKQALWRLDPTQSGISCCMGDIGVHAFNLTEYISGLGVVKICADLEPVVEDRLLDDDGTVLLRFDNGAKGVLLASQISVGEENNLRFRIYGEKASLDWSQMEPNSLWLRPHNETAQLIRTGVGNLCNDAQVAMRTPAGHPEGYLEAFANIYQCFANQLLAFKAGKPAQNDDFDVPGIEAAIRGMAFIHNVVEASQKETKWHNFQIATGDMKTSSEEQ